ncbi:hypothetical protein [Pandoraea apista]|uniref:hypothetical protein n=1 Tax=Pandoraea apista TaxID=93218 RepID=UPI00058A9D2D|nr:hypothetical protein [Pandoraea apista]AJE97199.1 hypothetical protein SG18_01700 [Pandoraea apista]AKH71159.1 hypothetical protein XM39_01700 [Pandoraea apista]AKI63430.1 hypothetical protein AA956_19020 [Pandoraea apista]
MKIRPAREDYRRWLEAQTATALDNESHSACIVPALPTALPFAGYVVWFLANRTYLDIRFDHHRFEIVTQQVPSAAEAFFFDSLDAAYGHAAHLGEPCLILFSATGGASVRVVG